MIIVVVVVGVVVVVVVVVVVIFVGVVVVVVRSASRPKVRGGRPFEQSRTVVSHAPGQAVGRGGVGGRVGSKEGVSKGQAQR